MAKKSTPQDGKKKRVIQKEIYVSDMFVSVIVALRSDLAEGINISGYLHELSDLLYRHYSNYEIIIIDNGLPTEVIDGVTGLLSELPCLRAIKLSRKYSHDMAIMAGLEGTIGDYTVITDPMLDPIKSIPKIISSNQQQDIIQGVASLKSEKSIKMTVFRRLFYRYSRRHMMIDVPTNATFFISLSRKAVAAITSSPGKSVHIKFIIRTIGYTYATFSYEVMASPIRKRSLRVGVFEAADIISSYSVHPLRFMSLIGLFASITSVVYAVYVIWVAFTQASVAEGWTTMSLQISGLFLVLFLIIMVLSEYISKLLVESRRDSRYYVTDELVSTVSLADAQRKNITVE